RFGDRPIHRVGTADIQQYLAERLEGICRKTQRPVAPATVNRELEIIRKMFNDAIAWGFLQENPCRGIRKLRAVTKKYQFLTEEEVAGLLEQASDNDQALLATAVYTGMRFGELVNLEPRHVDLKMMQITVEIGNAETGTTKSKKIRYVPIATALYPYLQKQLIQASKYVFPAKRKELMQRTEVDKAFRSTLRRIGVERHIRFHDLRHTFASHFVMRGGDLMSLKEIL